MAGYEILCGNDKHGKYWRFVYWEHKKGYEWSRWFYFLFVLFLIHLEFLFIQNYNSSKSRDIMFVKLIFIEILCYYGVKYSYTSFDLFYKLHYFL